MRLLFFFLTLTILTCNAQQKNIFFAFDSYELSDESKSTINKIIELNFDSIIIIGHCDSTGSLAYNQKLSEQRAKTTHEYIISKAPNAYVSELDGKSFLAPLKSNDTEENKALNRRVELRYFKSLKQKAIEAKKVLPERPVKKYKCQIIDLKNQFIPAGEVLLYNDENELVGKKNFTKGKAYFDDSVPFDRIRIDGEQYFSRLITYRTVQDYCTVRLQKIKKNSYFTFKNLGFIPNTPNLLPSAFPELEGLLKTLQNNPRLKIHIEGHTNGVNTKKAPEWHQNISTGRAKSVYEYLIEKGISESRLSYEGFGCTKMVFPHAANRAQAQENRRVEIKVKDF